MHYSLKAVRLAAVSIALAASMIVGASAAVYGQVSTSALNVRSAASTTSNKVGSLSSGTIVEILSSTQDGWYEISFNSGSAFVSSDYVTYGVDPNAVSIGQKIVATAQQYLGVPYVYGSVGPNSFDCSGFTRYVMAQHGFSLPHKASSQFSYGTAVSYDNLQPGDLVFFSSSCSVYNITHVGIYVGGGQFIHASTNTRTVQYSSMSGYYATRFVGARRLA